MTHSASRERPPGNDATMAALLKMIDQWRTEPKHISVRFSFGDSSTAEAYLCPDDSKDGISLRWLEIDGDRDLIDGFPLPDGQLSVEAAHAALTGTWARVWELDQILFCVDDDVEEVLWKSCKRRRVSDN